jgi:hypothetical protein
MEEQPEQDDRVQRHRGQGAGRKAGPGQLIVLQCHARRHADDDADHQDEPAGMAMVELHRVHDPVAEHDQDQHCLQCHADAHSRSASGPDHGRAAAASSTNEIEIVPKKLLCPGCISSAKHRRRRPEDLGDVEGGEEHEGGGFQPG